MILFSKERLGFIVGSMLILWIIEGAIPLLPLRYKKNKTRHAAVNLFFTIVQPGLVAGLIPFWILGAKAKILFTNPFQFYQYSGTRQQNGRRLSSLIMTDASVQFRCHPSFHRARGIS